MGWNGLPQNGEAALRHFEAAVERGDPAAKSALGQLFAQGIGVPQNNETALKYFREAARVVRLPSTYLEICCYSLNESYGFLFLSFQRRLFYCLMMWSNYICDRVTLLRKMDLVICT